MKMQPVCADTLIKPTNTRKFIALANIAVCQGSVLTDEISSTRYESVGVILIHLARISIADL